MPFLRDASRSGATIRNGDASRRFVRSFLLASFEDIAAIFCVDSSLRVASIKAKVCSTVNEWNLKACPIKVQRPTLAIGCKTIVNL